MTDPAPGTDRKLDWYRTMVRIRLFEEKVQELFMSGYQTKIRELAWDAGS